MIIYNLRKPEETEADNCVGVTGENKSFTAKFLIRELSDSDITFKIHLRFSDGSVNTVVPDEVSVDDTGTTIIWNVKKTDIFVHGFFETQIEGTKSDGYVFQTEIVRMFADESIAVEDKEYENPNSETLKLREEAYNFLCELRLQQDKLDQNMRQLFATDITNKADNALVALSGEGVLTFAPYTRFFNGQINSDGKKNSDIKYRVTSENIMKFDYDLNVSVNEGFNAYVVKYSDGIYQSIKSVSNYNYTIPSGTEFRLSIRRAVENTSEKADISEFVNAVKFVTKVASDISGINSKISEANAYISEINNELEEIGGALTSELALKWLQGNVPPSGGGAKTRVMAVLGLMKQPIKISWNDENRVVKIWGYDSEDYSARVEEISVNNGDTIIPTLGIYYVIVTRTEDGSVIKPAYGEEIAVSASLQKISEIDDRIKSIENDIDIGQDNISVGRKLKETAQTVDDINQSLSSEFKLHWVQGNVPPYGGNVLIRVMAVLGAMEQSFKISWTDENRVVKVWGYDSSDYSNRVQQISVNNGDTVIPTLGIYYVIVTRTDDSAIIKPEYGEGITVSVALQKIPELETRVAALEDKIISQQDADPIPEYYYENNYLQNKIDDIKKVCGILHGVTFAFITDVHFKDNQKKSKYLLEKILKETNVPFVIYGGDTISVYGTYDELTEQTDEFNDFKSLIGKDKLFCTRGNHDFYNVASETDRTMHTLNTADTYDMLFRDTERSVSSMSVNNGCYCIDDEPQKTRIIMLNTSDLSSEPEHTGGGILFRGSTLIWLADCLTEKNDYKIIIVSHHHINNNFVDREGNAVDYDFTNNNGGISTALLDLVSAFKNKETFTSEQFGVTVNADFTDTKNELVCVLSGHRHMDLASTQNGILNIVTTGDAMYDKDGYGRKAGTISEQAFDIVCVDYDTQKLNLIRIGAGTNREFDLSNL